MHNRMISDSKTIQLEFWTFATILNFETTNIYIGI